MIEAQDSVHLAQLRTTLTIATRTRALQVAMNTTKHQLRAKGLRVSQFSHREIAAGAEIYLAEHREELIADAEIVVARWAAVGTLASGPVTGNIR